MTESPFSNVYRKVTIDKSLMMGDPVCNEELMMKDQKRHKDALAVEAYNAKLMEENNARLEKESRWDAMTKKTILENTKNAYINQLAKELPDYLVGEAFADIYMRALPHNHHYVMEHYGQFNHLAHLYSNKIGGFNHLKRVAATTESTFLKQLTNYIQEAVKDAIVKKTEKVSKALTEDEVKQMINPMIDPDEKDKLLTKIDSLGADELAELVNQKVIAVVNDERRKIKQDNEFKNMLKNDLDDDMRLQDAKASDTSPITDKHDVEPEMSNEKDVYKKNKQEANDIDISTDEDDLDDDKPSKKGKKKDDDDTDTDTGSTMKSMKEATMNMSFMEAFQKWDPVQGTFDYNPNRERRTLFTSMMENIMTGFILESTGHVNRRRPSKAVYESPLNLVAIEDVLNPNREDESVSESDTSVRPHVDKSRIFSEALTQYTLIETAHTMKLINVTPVDVARQCEFLTTEYSV